MEKKNSSLRVSTDSIFFHDLKEGESDSIDFWIQNIGKAPIQLRFLFSPKSPFQLIHEGPTNIAPGLETRATIKYTSKSSETLKDTLKIITQSESIKIPIVATPPCPRIVPEKTVVNLGNVANDTDFKFIFTLSNIGTKEGEFSLSCSDESISFTPTNGTISAGKLFEVAGNFHPKNPGEYQFSINIEAKGSFDQPPSITAKATSLPNTLSLQLKGKNVSEFEFGKIYFGQKKVIIATIVNNGPYKRSFVIMPPKDTPAEAAQPISSARTPTIEKGDVIFSTLPLEGFLNSYEKKDIKIIFIPPDEIDQEEDIESTYNQFSSIEVVETGQKIDFSLSGSGVHPFVSFSEVDFDFDKTAIDTKTVKTVKISNLSQFLPVSFELHSIAQFRFEPMKGQISPGMSKEVKIIFYPRNYGIFDSKAKITFNSCLFSRHINLKASCGQKSEEKPFKRVPVWETDKEILFNVKHPDTRYSYDLDQIKENKKKKEEFDSYIKDSADEREKKAEQKKLLEHARKEAIQALTSSLGRNNFSENDIKEYIKTHREQLMTVNIETDLGIEPMEGLTPPDPPITKKQSPLFVQNHSAFGLSKPSSSAVANKEGSNEEASQKRSLKGNDNKIIKKKFKSKATTPAEINECNRTLTLAQQLMVVPSHQTINIGQISVFSTVVKSFTIENNLQQHIIVSMNYEYEELANSSPTSQVIPPKQTAGFDLKFSSNKPQNFMKTIQYQINGHHPYSFTFIAQVIPIDLQINQNFVEFKFTPDSNNPVIKEFVTLINKSNSRAEYNFTGISAPFFMSNPRGFVEANKNLNLEITYNPGMKTHDEQEIILNTLGGSSRALKLIGDTGNSKCFLQKKTINFGLLPIGIAKTQFTRLKNTGDDDAIFTVSSTNPSELQVSPMNGRVATHDSIQLQVTYKSLQPHQFNIPVKISICGSQPLTFNVIGQSELPLVQLENTEFDFGKVFVGSSATIETALMNIGSIPAVLTLDLQSHPEFRIEFPSEYSDLGIITLVSDPLFVTKMEGAADYRSPSNTNRDAQEFDEPVEEIKENKKDTQQADDETKTGLIYQIQLAEHTSLDFSLIFQPIEPCDISFELPISMMNIINSNSFHLQPIASGEGVQAPISLSTNSIDFGVAPIYDETNPNSRAVVRTISLLNEGKNEISWYFADLDEDLKKTFVIEPMEGKLEVSSTQFVHISFTPKEQMPYNAHFSLWVKTEKDDSLIGKVQMTGVCSSLPFRISLNEVCLPVVPLNIPSQMQIFVVNQAFIEGNLRIQTAIDENKFPLKVSFPEGNVLQHTTDKLPLLVSFQSSKPLSFSTLVAVLDEAGNAASFRVSCTTDNSCLTLFPYLLNVPNIPQTSPYRKSQSPSKKTPIDMNNVELTSRFINVDDYLELKNAKWEPKTSPLMIKFVQRYMNALVLSNQMSTFPDDLIANQSALLIEAISNLTGIKKNLGDDKATTPEKRCEAIRKVLYSLISNGALLSSIKPEFLLNKSDFMNLMRQKITRQLLGIDYFNAPEQSSFNQQVLGEFISSKSFTTNLLKRLKVLEGLYENLSIESWMIVIMQVFKLFIMPRVETEKLESIPGVNDTIRSLRNLVSKNSNGNEIMNELNKPSKVINGSNIFSAQEMTLLRWSGIHYANVTSDFERKFNDFSSFKDGAPIAALIKSHASIPFTNLNKKSNDSSQKEQTVIELINSMKLLKLSFYPQLKEIIDGEQCLIALTLGYLFDTLPHYIPQTTIEFQTSLHKPITKNVSITNSSKSEITYRASFKGNNNFVLTEDSLTVLAGQTTDFPIFFSARTIKPVTGRLSLIPSRPRFVADPSSSNIDSNDQSDGQKSIMPHLPQYSAPIVIDVISQVSLTSPEQSLTLETKIYQPKKIELNVENKFNTHTTLTIYSKVTKIEDENGRPVQGVLPLQQEMLSFINSPHSLNERGSTSKNASSSCFEEYVSKHQMLLLSTNSITFTDTNKTTMEVEFNPISLGTYRCLLLFLDENLGEFIYEIVAKSTIPQPADVNNMSISKLKVESGKKTMVSIPIELVNSNLAYSLAYSIEKRSNPGQNLAERKLNDLISSKQRIIESQFKSNFSSKRFSVVSSSQYFDTPNEVTISKSENKINSIQVTFKPSKAGEYPCKILLASDFDIRAYGMKGIGIAETKELVLEFQTLSGKEVKQEIPLHNISKDNWQYKITINGDSAFTAPQRVSVKPNSFSSLPISFSPLRIGQFSCEIQVLNLNKESSVVYKCTGTAGEPPTEDKIAINCKARELTEHQIDVKPFIKNGSAEVTTTIPIISFNKEVSFMNGQITKPFSFSILAPRSGISAGTITFTDPTTKNFIWYVVEINVSLPNPEQMIEVKTEARKSVTVSIPISNPKRSTAIFTALYSDDDLFGPKEFSVEANSSTVYELVVCPLKAASKTSAIYFYSDDDGEFWYKIKIDATEPPQNILAPMNAPIGRYDSIFILLSNPSSRVANYHYENDNENAFRVVAKRLISLNPHEEKRVEIRYIPTSVGQKETATISFISQEAGDWYYKLTGTGKPPQPLSPTIVTTAINTTSSALIPFNNPFPYPAKFSVSLGSENDESDEIKGLFEILNKKKVFTMNNYNEEIQIAFAFQPKKVGQFKAHIIIAFIGPARMQNDQNLPGIRWVYPIIGNSHHGEVNERKVLKCRAHETFESEFNLTLIGETDSFSFSEYSLVVNLPDGFEFIRSVLEIKLVSIEKEENSSSLKINVKFSPKRPFKKSAVFVVRNPLGQEWQFTFDLISELGKVQDTLTVESLLNKTGSLKISINNSFRAATPFHAYFIHGSASEFSVSPEHGIIEPSLQSSTELPIEVVFSPKMYGKVLKGMLVIDMLDAQFLFDILGKTPEYVPPVLGTKAKSPQKEVSLSSRSLQPKALADQNRKVNSSFDPNHQRKKNFIRENIDKARIVKPRVKSVMNNPLKFNH